MKQSKSSKAKIIISFIIIVGVFGFSASFLNFNKQSMSTSINSIWSINISSVEPSERTKTAYDLGSYVSDNLIVIKPYLEGPSDRVYYIITVRNNGTYDALLDNIDIDYKKNDLKFEFENIKEGDILERNTFKTFKLIVKYNDDVKDNRIIEPSKIVINLEYIKN